MTASNHEKDEERINLEALLAELLKLSLELFDLGKDRLEKLIQRELATEKRSVADRLELTVSAGQYRVEVRSKTSFKKDNFITDARACATERKAEVTLELENIKNKISQTLGFEKLLAQEKNSMAREDDDLEKKVGLLQVIAPHSLAVRERFFEGGKSKLV
ncbi:hypothetical protein EYC80_002527 [Monilinia laxa]|uniref:Uncharacterized protein n=1 Tax=Monilinia laxa TaxID=61186 RepID=A0A5N6K462_MONLA|nr:hypothetical protein EYC80_002527 [Monilinia laxa]